MNTFGFTANFGTEKDCRTILKHKEIYKESFVQNAVLPNTTGSKINGVMSVKNVIIEPLYEMEP